MPFDCTLKHPFNMLVSGPSKSGKTTFVSKLLKVGHDMFNNYPERVILYYATDQPVYQELYESGLIHKMFNFKDSAHNYNEIHEEVAPFKDGNGSLVIFDDTLTDIKSGFEKIFQVLGHHTKCSLIYITQNLFYNNNTFRNLSLQVDYMVLMRNQRNFNQIRSLSNQLCPNNPNYVLNSYNEATKTPFSYLMIDCSANSPNELRLRSHIFPDEAPYCVYLDK